MEKDHCKSDPDLKGKIWTLNENDDDDELVCSWVTTTEDYEVKAHDC